MTDQADSRDLATRRRRLKFRCWHRGTREADLLLGTFADRYVNEFSEEQLDRLEALLNESDPDLYDWISGRVPVPADMDTDVMRLLVAHKLSTPNI